LRRFASVRGRGRAVLTGRRDRVERLVALGVTPGARVRDVAEIPGFVFECDETEVAVEPAVARVILVDVG